jgi:preprotein translocase subunit SecA
MFGKVLSFLVDSNEKVLKKIRPLVEEINDLEDDWSKLSELDLQNKTQEFKLRFEKGETLDDLLPEAFASVREASKRTLRQRHFDSQLTGGIVLHQGKIAEMKTGEGKTLVATLPVYLNALTGKGVHLVTVNDYLARRDTQWMGPVYNMLGLSISCLQHDGSVLFDPDHNTENDAWSMLREVSRREAYAADITYGTNNEFGFDYLRDNMVVDVEQQVQRGHSYAIVDEVDNILIDEARTPLIISGPAQESTKLYSNFARLVPRLRINEDYTVDEKLRSITLTDTGIANMESWLNVGNLYDADNFILTHYIENALRAHVIYQRDKEYVVRDKEVVIVDEFTGRLMPGRRYSDGLHQAIEAKEGVKVQRESITHATITLQNYFRMYGKLSGMTGTASTEAEELEKIYKLEVVVIPTNKPMIREDFIDVVYPTEESKLKAITRDIEEINKTGRPILVGTVSIEKSETIAAMLKRKGIECQVLNAKQHELEATIVAQAGRLGAVTVATNMAGRGTDIILGGNPSYSGQGIENWQSDHEVILDRGGLHIIGTERHESRRIDNQLRGRSGRQGDNGSTRFYISLEDDLMRRFGGDRVKGFMEWAGLTEDTPIENGLINRSIEASQTKVEGYHFDMRKHLVEYDDVINAQRDLIYSERRKVLNGTELKTNIQDMIETEMSDVIENYMRGDNADEWDLEGLLADLSTIFHMPDDIDEDGIYSMHKEEITDKLLSHADLIYNERENSVGADSMRMLERLVMLRTIDSLWVQHLTSMENLRQGIGLHAFGQRDPLVMYKREGHEMFQDLLNKIQHDIVRTIYHVGTQDPDSNRRVNRRSSNQTLVSEVASRQLQKEPAARLSSKVGRNDQCPCGSGKKYKKCHALV